LSPVPDIDEVAGQAARDDEQCVDADIVTLASVARREAFGGDRDPAQAIFVECPGGGFLGAAPLDLDKGDDFSPASNEVDFTARNACTASKNSPALETQPPGGEGFCPPTVRFGDLPVQLPPPSSSARA